MSTELAAFKSGLSDFIALLDRTAEVDANTHTGIQTAYNVRICKVYAGLRDRGLLGSEASVIRDQVKLAHRKITQLKIVEVLRDTPGTDHRPTAPEVRPTATAPASPYLSFDNPTPEQALASLVGFPSDRGQVPGNIARMQHFLKTYPTMNDTMLARYQNDFNKHILQPYRKALAFRHPDFNKDELRRSVIDLQKVIETQKLALEDGKKHAYLNWGLGSLATVGAYMTLGACGLENDWLRLVPSAAAGYLMAANKPTLPQGFDAFGKGSLAMGTVAGVHLAARAIGSSSLITTVPKSLMYTAEIVSQPTMKGSAKAAARATAALGVGVLTNLVADYTGASYFLKTPLASMAITSADAGFRARTWTDTFKSLGKAAVSVGVGLAIQGGLTYLGVPTIVSSAIAAPATQGLMSIMGSETREEALAKTVRTAAGVGAGILTHKVYNAVGVDATPVKVCPKDSQGESCQMVDTWLGVENAGASAMASYNMSAEREGSPKEQVKEAVKDTAVAVVGSALIHRGGSYIGLPSQVTGMASTGFTVWRNWKIYKKIAEQMQDMGQLIQRQLLT